LSARRASTIEAIVNASVRCIAVAIAICSWIAISSHCALAIAASQEEIAQSDCPYHSHPAKPSKQRNPIDQPCCKILRALTPGLVKNPVRAIVELVDVDLSFAKLVAVAPPKISFNSFALDTGPPGTTSFAELIGSMRAHAPPTRI
jgi:DNA-binding transcriptional regulator YdaS (Cro superfamily)